MKPADRAARRARVSKICLALPEASRKDSGRHAGFRVRKSSFAYFLDDHHGDGIVSVCAKALPGDNKVLIAAQPERFYMPAYVGSRGWVGLRLDAGKVDWAEVREFLTGSYRLTAPKSLLKRLADV